MKWVKVNFVANSQELCNISPMKDLKLRKVFINVYYGC